MVLRHHILHICFKHLVWTQKTKVTDLQEELVHELLLHLIYMPLNWSIFYNRIFCFNDAVAFVAWSWNWIHISHQFINETEFINFLTIHDRVIDLSINTGQRRRSIDIRGLGKCCNNRRLQLSSVLCFLDQHSSWTFEGYHAHATKL
jgi:hypothetical protein